MTDLAADARRVLRQTFGDEAATARSLPMHPGRAGSVAQ